MDVTLSVKSDQVGQTLNEILATLTLEQKQDIAKQMLDKWFAEPIVYERQAAENIIIEKLRSSGASLRIHYNTKYPKDISDDEIKQSDEFKSEVSKFRSVKQQMIDNIIRTLIDYHQLEIRKRIESDPTLMKVTDAVFDEIKSKFGQIIQQAIIAWVCSNMNQIASDTTNAMNQLNTLTYDIQQITNKMLSQQ